MYVGADHMGNTCLLKLFDGAVERALCMYGFSVGNKQEGLFARQFLL